MNKTFSSHIFTYLKINRDQFDHQYEECLSALGQTEVQIKNEQEEKVSLNKLDVFKKRDKLMHSPELNKTSARVDDITGYPINLDQFSQSQNDNLAENLITNGPKLSSINTLLEKTHYKVFKFDKVIDYTRSDYEIYKENFEKIIEDAATKSKNIFFLSFSKSNTILNYQLEEGAFTSLIMNQGNKTSSGNSNDIYSYYGLMPSCALTILQQFNKNKAKIENIFDEDQYFDTMAFSAYSIQAGKIQNLIFPSEINNNTNNTTTTTSSTTNSNSITNEESKPIKEIVKVNIDSINTLKQLCLTVRNNLITKKSQIGFIIYRIKLTSRKRKNDKMFKTSLIFIDFLNIYDKEPFKFDYQNFIESFALPVRIIYTIFTNAKNTMYTKEKFFQVLVQYWNYNTKLFLIGNTKATKPYLNHSQQLIAYLDHIHRKKDTFDTLYLQLVYQKLRGQRLKATFNLPNNYAKQQDKISKNKGSGVSPKFKMTQNSRRNLSMVPANINDKNKSEKLEQTCQLYQEEIKKYEKSIGEYNKLIDEYKAKNDELQNKITNKENEFMLEKIEFDKKNKELQTEIDFLKERAKLYVTEIKQVYEEEKKELLMKIEELEKNQENLIQDGSKPSKTSLSNISFSADLSMFHPQQENKKQSASISQIPNEKKLENESFNRTIDNLKNNLHLQSQEINVLRKVNEELAQENEALKQNKLSNPTENSNIPAEESAIKDIDKTFSCDHMDQIKKLEAENDQKIQELMSKIQKYDEEYAKLQKDNEGLKASVILLIEKFTDEIENVQKFYINAFNRIKNLQQKKINTMELKENFLKDSLQLSFDILNQAFVEIKEHKFQNERLVDENLLVVSDLYDKFKTLKQKVMKKLDEKDQRIDEYNKYFNEINQKLTNFNDISRIGAS